MNGYEHEAQGRAAFDDRPFNKTMPELEESYWLRMEYYLRSRDLSFEVAKFNGWYPSTDAGDYDARVVIPATASEHNVYWQARSMEKKPLVRYQSPAAPRGDALVLVWPQLQEALGVAISEGPMDALAAAGEGWLGVGLMGTTPPLVALQLLVKIARPYTRVLMLEDTDQNGALRRALLFLLARGVAGKLKMVYPYKDLAAAPKEQRAIVLTT